jgi:hypothetical protein
MSRFTEVSSARWLAYLAVCVGLAAVGGYLWTEHRQHLAGLLFYGLALACPLLHLFGHRREHGHAGHERVDAGPGRHG